MSLRDDATFVEVFYMKRAACLWRGRIDVDANGDVEVPRPGSARTGQGRHGAIPRVVTAGATSCRPLPAQHPRSRRGILRGARRPSSRLPPPCAMLAHDLLQANDRVLQRLDLPVGASIFCWSVVSLLIVFCRKSTLLCRQEVRRSIVFSTVQISMPGTSCA